MITLESIRKLVADLPGIEEGKSCGTPAFGVRKIWMLSRVNRIGT
jgi:hypothetical protein